MHGLSCFNVSDTSCVASMHGKQQPKPSPYLAIDRATSILELVHIYFRGPMRHTTLGGVGYFILIIDDFSRQVWVHLCSAKFEAFSRFQEWVSLVETKTFKKVNKIRANNGGEFISCSVSIFCWQQGIACQFSVPSSPQQN